MFGPPRLKPFSNEVRTALNSANGLLNGFFRKRAFVNV